MIRAPLPAPVASFFSPGAVHLEGPDRHWLMAQTILPAWHPPGPWSPSADRRGTEGSRASSPGPFATWPVKVTAAWLGLGIPLPMPIDPEWDRRSIEPGKGRGATERRSIGDHGPSGERYRLLARLSDEPAEIEAGAFPREQLERGLDLPRAQGFWTSRRSRSHERSEHGVLQGRRRTVDAVRRRSIAKRIVASSRSRLSGISRADDLELAEIRRLRQSSRCIVRLVAAE